MRTAAALLASAGLLLAACGGGKEAAPATADPTAGASAEPTASPSASPARRQPAPSLKAPKATKDAGGKTEAPATSKPARDPEEQAALSDLAAAAQQAAKKDRKLPKGPVLGADVSWPQCPKGMGIPQKRTLGMPMPLPKAKYVVVGLTNGPGFTRNPCLAAQVRWVRSRDLLLSAYAVASYPSKDQVKRFRTEGPYNGKKRLGRLRNAGFQQARYSIAAMREAGMDVPAVWVDVEPVPDFEWSSDLRENAAVVQGVVRAYGDAGYRVGVYSTPALWARVVGDLALGLPEWRAAGQTSRQEARSRCGADWVIQGGAAVLGQWVEQRRDQNVTCPGATRELPRYFSR